MANKRLIDAEAVRHKINAFAALVVYRGSDLMFTGKDSCNPHEYTRGYEQGVLDAQKIVCGQDPVDAVEVVRCKDCRHLEITGCYGECKRGYMGIVKPWDSCSCGERREGDGNL